MVIEDAEHKRVMMERDLAIERFRLMSKAMNEGMWDWNMQTDVAWYSDAIYSVFGLDHDVTPTYERWTLYVHPDDRERVTTGFRLVFERGESEWSAEYRFVRPDGRVLEVWDRGYVMVDDNGKPVRMVGVVMDITQRRALERQLTHAQKMEAVGQLAGGIAHDFNNMVQAAKLELALLREIPDASPKVLSHAREIAASLDRATSLTRQLQMFGRREAMRLEAIDVNGKANEIASMLRRVLGAQIVVDLALADGLLLVHADSSMLDQVILNLAVNARDAMPNGGSLSIATSRRSQELPEHATGNYVCLEVRDTGTGISPEVLPRIFEPFFTTKDVNGTGLGLATAHGIVEQHRGWIEVDSKLAQGTTFRVFLPEHDLDNVTRGALARDEAGESASKRPGKETVLVVEDDGAVRRAMCDLLGSTGYTVLAADCGPAAIKTWDQHGESIDLLLTDLVMPGGINGRELATLLSARRPGLKIILVTGHSRDLDANLYQQLHKPVEPESLLATVRACLDR